MAAQAILRRCGRVLITFAVAVAVLGGVLASTMQSAHVTVDLVALIGSWFLLRGSLRAARVLNWLGVIFAMAQFGAALSYFFQPISLTLTELRLEPAGLLVSSGLGLGSALVWVWAIRELRRPPVRAACAEAGRRVVPLGRPIAVGGVILAIVMGVVLTGLGGETAAQASQVAEQRLGPDYRYHVTALHIATGSGKRRVSAQIVAWRDADIQRFTTSWEDAP